MRRYDANSRSNVRPATGVPDHGAANSEKEATMTKQANDFRGRIFSREDIFARGYFRDKIFSREDIFAGRYFRVNSILFAKISSSENISNSLFAKLSSRENKVLYSIRFTVYRTPSKPSPVIIGVRANIQLGVKPSFARMANTNCLSCGPAREKKITMNYCSG